MPCSVQFSPDKCVMNPPTIHDYILTYKQNLHTRMATLVVLISVVISLSSVLGLETYTVGMLVLAFKLFQQHISLLLSLF